MRFIWQKKKKIVNVGKIRKYEEKVFFEKKTFSFSKLHLYQIGKAQKNASGSRPSYLHSAATLPRFPDFRKIEMKDRFFSKNNLFSYIFLKYNYFIWILRQICFRHKKVSSFKWCNWLANLKNFPLQDDDFPPILKYGENNNDSRKIKKKMGMEMTWLLENQLLWWRQSIERSKGKLSS